MSVSSDSLPNCSCFDIFVRDPKNTKHEIVLGVHRFLSEVIEGKEKSPVNSVFVGLRGSQTGQGFFGISPPSLNDYIAGRFSSTRVPNFIRM